MTSRPVLSRAVLLGCVGSLALAGAAALALEAEPVRSGAGV